MILYDILADYFLAVFIVVVVEGRCRDIDHQVWALFHQLIHRAYAVKRVITQVPDVFTDGQRNLLSFERDHLPFIPRFEIPVFVEYIIVWKTGLMRYAFYLFFIKQPGCVKKVLPLALRITRRASDDHTDGVRLFTYPVDRRISLCNEILEFQEVTGWVPTYGELGKYHQVGPGLFRLPDTFQYLTGIRFEITHVIVLLCQCDLHTAKLR